MPLEGKKSNCLTNEKYGQPLHTVTKQKIQGQILTQILKIHVCGIIVVEPLKNRDSKHKLCYPG